jgi:glucose/mannose transport system permease protein
VSGEEGLKAVSLRLDASGRDASGSGAPRAAGLLRRYCDVALTALAIWPPLILSAGQVVVFTLWTAWLSFTPSTLIPEAGFVGWRNYSSVIGTRNFHVAYINVVIFGVCFVALTSALGMLLAVLLDQRVRGENIFRTIFLYPMAISFVVTGTIWSWLLNPGIGIQSLVRGWGWTGFRFDWLVDRDMAIYTLVIAGAWQAAGFAMALFLAGLRSVDAEIIKAAQIDGASAWRIYHRVVLPTIGPIMLAVMVILLQMAIKTFDLVRALTGGGPGIATNMPATVVYDFMFQRGQIGRGAAAAMLMLLALVVVILPYKLHQRWRGRAQ